MQTPKVYERDSLKIDEYSNTRILENSNTRILEQTDIQATWSKKILRIRILIKHNNQKDYSILFHKKLLTNDHALSRDRDDLTRKRRISPIFLCTGLRLRFIMLMSFCFQTSTTFWLIFSVIMTLNKVSIATILIKVYQTKRESR